MFQKSQKNKKIPFLCIKQSRLGVYLSHLPTSTSAQNLLHFDQLFESNRFQMFDYGPRTNLAIYRTPEAPDYDLSRISHPNTYVIYALNDYYTPIDGIAALKADLQLAEFYEISDPKGNHLDPLFGIDVAREVNQKILQILHKDTRPIMFSLG